MEDSETVKTCYIRSGTYNPSSVGTGCNGDGYTQALDLESSDAGETWSYYPPDGYDSAIINGGSTGNNGLGGAICINTGATDVTINGLQFTNFNYFVLQTNSTGTVIENNVLNGVRHGAGTSYAIDLNGASSPTVTNNVVENASEIGIGAWQGGSDLTISNNYVYNTCTAQSGAGGIYIEPNGNSYTGTNVISYNYVTTVTGAGGCEPIYLDDLTSGFQITGNVMAYSLWQCYFVHGGSNNVATGNICDLGSSDAMGIVSAQNESGAMIDNTWQNNIILANSASDQGGGYTCNSSPCQMTIGPNDYYNYGHDGSINDSGSLGTDSGPVTDNPDFTCGWEYTLPSNSPVYSSPVDFPQQPNGWGAPGFWGPPGFTIPQNGQVPSPPHTC